MLVQGELWGGDRSVYWEYHFLTVCIYPVSLVIEFVYRFKYQMFGVGTFLQQILNRIFEISVIKRIPLMQVEVHSSFDPTRLINHFTYFISHVYPDRKWMPWVFGSTFALKNWFVFIKEVLLSWNNVASLYSGTLWKGNIGFNWSRFRSSRSLTATIFPASYSAGRYSATGREPSECGTACSPGAQGSNAGFQKSELCIFSLLCLMFWSLLPPFGSTSGLLDLDPASEWLRKPDNRALVSVCRFGNFEGISSSTRETERPYFCVITGTGEFG